MKIFWVEIVISFRSRIIAIKSFILHFFKLVNTSSKFQCVFDFLINRISNFVQLVLSITKETLVSKLNQISVFLSCNSVLISIRKRPNIYNMGRLIRQSFLHEVCLFYVLSFIVSLLWLTHISRSLICIFINFIRIVFYFIYFINYFFSFFFFLVTNNRSSKLFIILKYENICKFIYSLVFWFD